MHQPKKICSLGILDINLNLELSQKEATVYNFNINKYNSIRDLQNMFLLKNNYNSQLAFNIVEHISLSSNNNLINALLFINRAYKNKSFIEFIMPNEMEFNEDNKFFAKIIKYILDKNYFFIIENKITNIPSSIKLIIKIYKDKSNEIISKKEFQLFEKNNIKINNYTENIFNEINYNFKVNDYFILFFDSFNNHLWENKDTYLDFYSNLISFLYNIIEQNNKIKILTIISRNKFDDKNLLNKLKFYMEIIELSDIIFSFKDNLNYFFQMYNSVYNDSNYDFYIMQQNYKNNKDNTKDLILYDKNKYRKKIPRISILFNEFDYISIYIQKGKNMDLDYIEIFFFNLIKEYNNISDLNNYYYYFIGGFLSRFVYDKPFKICSSAGQLLLSKIFNSKIINCINVDDYNISVPNKKRLINKDNLKTLEKLPIKEFDISLNISHNKKNNIFINNNESDNYFYKNNLEYLKKIGFINRNNIIIKDPNSEINLNYKNKYNLFKTSNNYHLNMVNKNKSMINLFEKYKKKRIIKKESLPKMVRNSSMTLFNINVKNSNIKINRKYRVNFTKKNERPKSNYCRNKNGSKYNLRLNNNSQFPYNYKYSFKRSNSTKFNY